MRKASLAVLALALASLAAHAPAAAAEVKVVSVTGVRIVLQDAGPQFERASGHKLAIQYGLLAQLKETIDSGVFDLAISTGPITAHLIKENRLVANTRAEIARVGIGVSIRAGTPNKPDISTVEGFKRALLNAKSISYTKGSAAGTYIAGMLEKLGIAKELAPKTKLMGGGGQNPKAVAAGEVELGLSIISDILPIAGAELLGPFPRELQNYVVVSVGVGAGAKEPDAARAAIAFLKTPAAMAVFKSKGYEPITP
jgi:molybdate transport system substrate-binding protein